MDIQGDPKKYPRAYRIIFCGILVGLVLGELFVLVDLDNFKQLCMKKIGQILKFRIFKAHKKFPVE